MDDKLSISNTDQEDKSKMCGKDKGENTLEKQELKYDIQLADLIIEVYPRYPTLKEFCKDYICSEDVIKHSSQDKRLTIRITDEDINKEKEMSEEEWTPQYLETLAALRKISDQMPEYHRFLCHGAAITWKEKGYLFTAPSGTGKSTHISLWRKYLGEDVQIVNGDKPFMKAEGEEIKIYGSPWAGKEGWQKNRSTTLDAICILEQSKENKIKKLEPSQSVPRLIRQIYFTENAAYAGKTLELMDLLLKKVPVYLLECDISKEAVRCSFEALTGMSMQE